MSPHINSVTDTAAATAAVSTVYFCWYIFSLLFFYTFQVSLFIHKHSCTDCRTVFLQLYSEMFNAILYTVLCIIFSNPSLNIRLH